VSRSANDPGGFAKSAGGATARGIALIAVAVVLGFVLLSSGLDDDTTVEAGSAENATTTTVAEGGTDGSTPGSTTATTSATPKPPNEVRVLVANGSGVQGAAGTMNDAIKAKGYIGLDPKNAAGNVPTTVVYFAEGYQREAAAVATAIGADPATVQAMPNPPPLEDPAALQDANVLIVLGPDLAQPGA
jgi:hypothetical protein